MSELDENYPGVGRLKDRNSPPRPQRQDHRYIPDRDDRAHAIHAPDSKYPDAAFLLSGLLRFI
jgi:hypothetical protein